MSYSWYSVAYPASSRNRFVSYACSIGITWSNRPCTRNTGCVRAAGSFGLTGRQAESALLDSGLVTNRNTIPNDANGAWYTSGIRLGTPALTTLGLGADELTEVADILVEVLRATKPASASSGPSKARFELASGVRDRARGRAADLLERFPLYPTIEL